jgi:hypothetical protein
MTDPGQPPVGDANDGDRIRETARQLQMSVTTVRRWVYHGWLTSTTRATGERGFVHCPAVAAVPPVCENPSTTAEGASALPDGGAGTP